MGTSSTVCTYIWLIWIGVFSAPSFLESCCTRGINFFNTQFSFLRQCSWWLPFPRNAQFEWVVIFAYILQLCDESSLGRGYRNHWDYIQKHESWRKGEWLCEITKNKYKWNGIYVWYNNANWHCYSKKNQKKLPREDTLQETKHKLPSLYKTLLRDRYPSLLR